MKVTQFGLIEGAAAATPPSGIIAIYAKTDNLLYWKDDTGAESQIGSSVGGSVTSVGVSGGTTGLTVSGSPITTSGTITLAGTLDIDNGGTGATTLAGASIATYTGTETLTNKRITSRVQSVTNAATITPAGDTNDAVDITAIAQAFTIANPTGTLTNFQKLIIRIKDNGTARAITCVCIYVAG